MVIEAFPPLSRADKHGLLAIGGDLEVDSLLLAYSSGIFPWPFEDDTLAWFAPPKRAVLFADKLHIAQSLKKELKRDRFEFTTNTAFEEVMRACSELKNRGMQQGTWITEDMISAYCEMHRCGFAHSFEAKLNGKLVGGLYGVKIDKYFSAESMYYRVPNASKIVLVKTVEFMKAQGTEWIDCQVVTPATKSFGVQEVTRAEFMKMLAKALK